MLSIEVLDSETGSTGQMRQGKLMAVDYDPVGKGNDIVVTTGETEVDYSHTSKATSWSGRLSTTVAKSVLWRSSNKTKSRQS